MDPARGVRAHELDTDFHSTESLSQPFVLKIKRPALWLIYLSDPGQGSALWPMGHGGQALLPEVHLSSFGVAAGLLPPSTDSQ